MGPLSRRVLRAEPQRVAGVALGAAVLVLLAAFGLGISTSQVTAAGLASALALVAIVGAGLLYAWRPDAGGPVE